MLQTQNHKLNKPEISDDVLDTIAKLSQNFDSLDLLVDENTNNLTSFLVSGKNYLVGKRVWNGLPVVGGTVGWVNIRTGKYAPTWQERTSYSLGNLVMPQTNNGHLYECIESGTSGVSMPVFPTSTGGAVFDTTGASIWTSNYVYEVDDMVFATVSNQLYYYKCISGGTSGAVEPTWALTSGQIINDGSVTWQSYKSVKWKEVGVSCEFREFGKIL